MSVASRRLRDTQTPSVSSPASASAPPLVPQSLENPLTDAAHIALADVLRNQARFTKLSERLALAIKQVTETTGDINDSGYEKKVRYDKAAARRRANGEDSDSEDRETNTAFQVRVQDLTKKMDLSIRSVIDDQIWVEDFPEMARNIISASEEQSTQYQERHAQSPTPIQSTQHTQGERDDDDSEMQDIERHSKPAVTPHNQLHSLLQSQSRDWQTKTLTEKYAPNNDYRGWKRVWYDANNPGESAPPMPDDSLWFAEEEGRTTRPMARRGHAADRSQSDDSAQDEDSGSDVEISREKTRLKCPITLLPYQDPVTSVNCKHSYEREAIFDMLRTSSDHIPFSSQQQAELSQIRNRRDREKRERELAAHQERQVKCPECNVPLRKDDLRPNPALQRRAQKLIAKLRAELRTSDAEGSENDDEDEEDDMVRDTQRRPVGVGSSPPRGSRRSLKSVKAEKRDSIVPQTQLSEGATSRRAVNRSRTVDMDDESENDGRDTDE